MNCRQTAAWLFHADDLKSPPGDVRGHLEECVRCRRRRVRLGRLHRFVTELPVPACDPSLQARVLERIAATAVAPTVVLPQRRWRSILARAAMVLLLVGGFGGLALHLGNPDPVVVRPREGDVVGRLVDSHVRLAQGLPPDERCRVLAEMGKDLGEEALRLAKQREIAELPALATMYDRIVGEDLVDRIAQLPADVQRPLAQTLAAELRQTEFDANRAADLAAPEAAAALRNIAATAKGAHARLSTL
jgi:hypothetical protein